MIDIKHMNTYTHIRPNSRIHWQMRGVFRFSITSQVGLGRALADSYTDTKLDAGADIWEKIGYLRPDIL